MESLEQGRTRPTPTSAIARTRWTSRRVGQSIADHCFRRRGDGRPGQHGERELFRCARRTPGAGPVLCSGREPHALVTSGHRVLSRILEVSAGRGPFGHRPDGHRERQSLHRHWCGPHRLSRHLYGSPGGRVGSADDAAPVASTCQPDQLFLAVAIRPAAQRRCGRGAQQELTALSAARAKETGNLTASGTFSSVRVSSLTGLPNGKEARCWASWACCSVRPALCC